VLPHQPIIHGTRSHVQFCAKATNRTGGDNDCPLPVMQSVFTVQRLVLLYFAHTNSWFTIKTFNLLIQNLQNKIHHMPTSTHIIPSPITITFPSVPITCASVHLNALKSLNARKKKMKAKCYFTTDIYKMYFC
jgi:hypothetical protein